MTQPSECRGKSDDGAGPDLNSELPAGSGAAAELACPLSRILLFSCRGLFPEAPSLEPPWVVRISGVFRVTEAFAAPVLLAGRQVEAGSPHSVSAPLPLLC